MPEAKSDFGLGKSSRDPTSVCKFDDAHAMRYVQLEATNSKRRTRSDETVLARRCWQRISDLAAETFTEFDAWSRRVRRCGAVDSPEAKSDFGLAKSCRDPSSVCTFNEAHATKPVHLEARRLQARRLRSACNEARAPRSEKTRSEKTRSACNEASAPRSEETEEPKRVDQHAARLMSGFRVMFSAGLRPCRTFCRRVGWLSRAE